MMHCSGGERFHHLVQPALVPSSLVLVDDSLVDHAVDHRHSSLVGGSGCVLVALLDRSNDCLDVRAHFGAQPHVMEPGLVGLPGTFPG